MQTALLAGLSALIGGGYEAVPDNRTARIGAYSLAQGMGIIPAGAIVGAIVSAGSAVAQRALRRAR